MNAFNSVGAIAAGNISGAAGLVERSLAGAIPLALSFVAKLVGIGNLGGKIKSIITKVRSRLDGLVDKMVGKVKGLLAKLGGGKDGKTTKDDKNPDDKKQNVDGTYGRVGFQAGKESHSVWTVVKNSIPEIYIASTPDKAISQLSRFKKEAVALNVFNDLRPHFSDAGKAVAVGILVMRKSINSSDRNVRLMITSEATESSNQIARYVGVIRKNIQEARDKPTQMPLITVLFSAASYPKDVQEYRLQLFEQQMGINRKTIAQWLSARSAFIAGGRGGATAQCRARQARLDLLIATFTQRIRKAEPSKPILQAESEASTLARQWLTNQRALHAPDQVAGSMANEIVALGKKEINGSIGGSWPSRIGSIDSGVANFISTNPTVDQTRVKMNVRLSL
ncbi:hypothetical protein EHF33_13635 [Deinococcus psychrotolerans]|uniref:Novel toxin 15 domain-containing protein n=1 Tax=Deinococcus psychrotolerans TaxID=2489213 RepID=A0A3G8YEC3_9DEIO|nr:polymorphic toxin type 15 domain-containing protein [Deinococcus psychrotolerans]AZI43662.1 hypothetical protein EHF33_13635 [Deinococcus psychrotolerans]